MHVGADPYRTELRVDVLDAEWRGQHLGQRVHVDLELRVLLRAQAGGFELDPHIAGQVLGGVDELVGRRVGEHEVSQRLARLAVVHAEQVGDEGDVDAAGAVEADRDGVGWAVDALHFGTRHHHAVAHDRGGRRGLVLVVELFQRQHQGAERVGAQQPDRCRHDAREGLLAVLVRAPGPLSLLAFLFLCSGFAVQPAVRRAQHNMRRKRTTGLATQLEPLWNRASLVRPGLSRTDPLAASVEDPESRLHREIVEIRDAMIDPRVTFDISAAERTLLERAESHLLGPDTTATPTTASPVSQVDEGGRS